MTTNKHLSFFETYDTFRFFLTCCQSLSMPDREELSTALGVYQKTFKSYYDTGTPYEEKVSKTCLAEIKLIKKRFGIEDTRGSESHIVFWQDILPDSITAKKYKL